MSFVLSEAPFVSGSMSKRLAQFIFISVYWEELVTGRHALNSCGSIVNFDLASVEV